MILSEYRRHEADHFFSQELLSDELVLWSGQPNPHKIFTGFDILFIPFSILLGGYAILWTIALFQVGGLFGLFGILFTIVGLYIMIGRFFVKKSKKKNTYYAITNFRVLILNVHANGYKRNISSGIITNISSDSLSIDSNGIGTIIFGTVPFWYSMYINSGMDFMAGFNISNSMVVFFDVDECDQVYQIYKNVKFQKI